MRSTTIRSAVIVGALAAVLGVVLGRTWVLIGLVAGYVVVTIWTRYEERKLLEDLRRMSDEDRERVLSHDPELGADLKKKL